MASDSNSNDSATSDPLAAKLAEADRLLGFLAEKVSEISSIRDQCTDAKVRTESERDAALNASKEATNALAIAVAERDQIVAARTSAIEARKATEGEKEKASQASTAANTARLTAEEQREKIVKAHEAASVALGAIETERKKAVQASAAANSAKEQTESEKGKTTEARVATESAKKEIESLREQAIAALKAASDAKAKAEAARDASTKAQGEALEASNLATAARTSVDSELDKSRNAAASTEATKVNAETTRQSIETLEREIRAVKEEADAALAEAQVAAELAEDANLTATAEAKRAAEAHNLSTTAGLAGAFNEKAQESKVRENIWIGILVFSLIVICVIGIWRYHGLTEFLTTKPDLWTLGVVVLLAVLGASGPIWLAWISTRMVSKNFSLTEDYAYKASLAKAYVGFRQEAKGLDPLLQERLFAAAITQLDANPVRLLDASHPGSPLQDLLQQPFMQYALMNDPTTKQLLIEWFNRRFKTRLTLRPMTDGQPIILPQGPLPTQPSSATRPEAHGL